MFNVLPVSVHYTHTPNVGVLRGIPLKCTIGVESREAAIMKIQYLQERNDGSLYSNFSVDYRK